MINFLGDLVLAGLLLLTTGWCVLLSRQLRRLRMDRRDIETLVAAIDVAAGRAETAVSGIRETAKEAQLTLSRQRELIDARVAELARLAEGGAHMARRLETVVQRGARTLAELQHSPECGRAASSTRGSSAKVGSAPEAALAAVANTHGTPAAGRVGPGGDALLRALEGLR
jgi:hypothetical protein